MIYTSPRILFKCILFFQENCSYIKYDQLKDLSYELDKYEQLNYSYIEHKNCSIESSSNSEP